MALRKLWLILVVCCTSSVVVNVQAKPRRLPTAAPTTELQEKVDFKTTFRLINRNTAGDVTDHRNAVLEARRDFPEVYNGQSKRAIHMRYFMNNLLAMPSQRRIKLELEFDRTEERLEKTNLEAYASAHEAQRDSQHAPADADESTGEHVHAADDVAHGPDVVPSRVPSPPVSREVHAVHADEEPLQKLPTLVHSPTELLEGLLWDSESQLSRLPNGQFGSGVVITITTGIVLWASGWKKVKHVFVSTADEDSEEYRVYFYRVNFWKGQLFIALIGLLYIAFGYGICISSAINLLGGSLFLIVIVRAVLFYSLSDKSAMQATIGVIVICWMPCFIAAVYMLNSDLVEKLLLHPDADSLHWYLAECCSSFFCTWHRGVSLFYFPAQWMLGVSTVLTDVLRYVRTVIVVQLSIQTLLWAVFTQLFHPAVWREEDALSKMMILGTVGIVSFLSGVTMAKVHTHSQPSQFKQKQKNSKKKSHSLSASQDVVTINEESGSSNFTAMDVGDVDDMESSCVVCLELPKDHLLAPCGHVCVCSKCAELLVGGHCPVCRAECSSAYKAYF